MHGCSENRKAPWVRWALQPLLLVWVLPLLLMSACASLPTGYERSQSYFIEDTAGTRLGLELDPEVAKHPEKSGFHVLRQGIEAFSSRLLLVEQAEKSLDIQYYIWHEDLAGQYLHYQLMEAAERGVRVRLLLDDLDTAGKDAVLQTIDAHPNVEIRLFNPFANRKRRIGDFLTDTRRINRRMHNKSLTADNQATIFGGRNIGDEYFDVAEDINFADLDVLAIGPVVTEVSQSFDLYWNSQWAYPLSAFTEDYPVDAGQIQAYRRQTEAFVGAVSMSDYAQDLRELRLGRLSGVAGLSYAWSKWNLVYDHPDKVEAKEVRKETHLAPSLMEAIDGTRRDLLVVSPYFVPGREFTDYLVGMVENGKRVAILTNSLAANDVSLVHAGYMRYRKDLLKGGVELYEFKTNKTAWIERARSRTQWSGSSRASLHGKFLAIDRREMFVGSFNLDARSVALNTELGVFFDSPKFGWRLAREFDNMWMNRAYRLELTDAGIIQWITEEGGKEVIFSVEPDTGFWQRFNAGFFSIFVPESQL